MIASYAVPTFVGPPSGTAILSAMQLAARDTLVTIPAPVAEWRLWLSVITDIAAVLIALALLVTVLILLLIALQVRKLVRKVDPLIDQARTYVDPVLGNVREVSENVNYMSSAIRADVQQVTEMVDTSRRRLNRAADAAESRIREFNALLGVMQEEAEQLFIDTASTIRGVQAGTETYRAVQRTDRGREVIDPSAHPATPPNRTQEEL